MASDAARRVADQQQGLMDGDGGVIDLGRTVICDAACGGDYTDSPDSGGFLFNGSAYCPECATDAEPRIAAYGEGKFIEARCPAGVSFADWVRSIRAGSAQGNLITVEVRGKRGKPGVIEFHDDLPGGARPSAFIVTEDPGGG